MFQRFTNKINQFYKIKWKFPKMKKRDRIHANVE